MMFAVTFKMGKRTVSRFISTMLIALFAIAFATPTFAQDDEAQIVLRDTVSSSFGKVWSAVRECMDERGCGKPQTDKIIEPVEEIGLYKGVYVSDFCMLVTGEDSTKSHMEQFGDVPRIRGGIWITGRIQYKINVKEVGIRQSMILVRAELSGFEEFITNRVYFWSSNGIKENEIMAAIKAKLTTEDGKTD